MFKKSALIVLMIVVLLCSVNAVAAYSHYSYITTNNCQGNFKIYNGNGVRTMNWNFGINTQQRIITDGWRKVVINPLGVLNSNTVFSWSSVPKYLNLYKKDWRGNIGISGWC